MEYENFQYRTIDKENKTEIIRIQEFLKQQHLRLDENLEEIIGIYQGEQILAVGGIHGKTLRSIAVDPKYKGTGVINSLMSQLMNAQYQRGNTHLFIYTKPENIKSFSYFGFKTIAQVEDKVALLENNPQGIENFVREVSKEKKQGKIISSLVMNCNPFTLGHQYLIEKAAQESDVVHLFVVWEDRSLFPSEVRYELIKKGIAHLKNVNIHKGKDYIISNATFPSYFIKDEGDVVRLHAMLDIEVFAQYMVPALGINKRFIGEEPYCPVTKTYNEVMKEILPGYGVEVVEIPRVQKDHEIISASKVRELIRVGKIQEIEKLVPQTTYNFLLSEKAIPIIEKIKKQRIRH